MTFIQTTCVLLTYDHFFYSNFFCHLFLDIFFYPNISFKSLFFIVAGEERGEWDTGDDEGVHGQGGGVLLLPALVAVLLTGILTHGVTSSATLDILAPDSPHNPQ